MKYVIVVNNGIFCKDDGSNVFDGIESIKEMLVGWCKEGVLIDEEEEELSFDDGIEKMKLWGLDCWNESMVEYGDDFVSLEIVELK